MINKIAQLKEEIEKIEKAYSNTYIPCSIKEIWIELKAELKGILSAQAEFRRMIDGVLYNLSQEAINNINNIMYKHGLGDFRTSQDWCEENKEYNYININAKISVLEELKSKLGAGKDEKQKVV